jgi:hypothetical protein
MSIKKDNLIKALSPYDFDLELEMMAERDKLNKQIANHLNRFVALEGERCRGCDNILQECDCIDNE